MLERDQVIDKVQKLLRLAESDNEHEAQLAADRAAELMHKYKIQIAMLGIAEDGIRIDKIELWDKMSVDWHGYLAAGVADVNDCGVWVQNRRCLMICGTDASTQVCNYMFHYLLRTIRKLSRMYIREFYGAEKGLHKERMAFAAGCVSRVVERLRDRKRARESETKIEHGCTALMVIDKERAEVVRWMRSNLDLHKARPRRQRGGQAFMDGRSAGDLVDIRDGLKGGSSPKQIGS